MNEREDTDALYAEADYRAAQEADEESFDERYGDEIDGNDEPENCSAFVFAPDEPEPEPVDPDLEEIFAEMRE